MPRERILVVDDNPANLKLGSVLLSSAGFEVRTAIDADHAIEVLRSFQAQLILMDLQLPGMDGLELTKRLKADPATNHIVILAMTAYAMKGDEEKARTAGCDGYITKPIDTRTLSATIEAHLGEEAPPAATAAAEPSASTAEPSVQTVLVVEDNPITRKMTRIALECEGYRILEAENGTAALRILERERPDLILQDLALPDMDGLELLERIRAHPSAVTVPMIVLSGRVDKIEELRSRGSRFDDFLTKPIEPSRLAQAVAQWLRAPAIRPESNAGEYHVLVVDDEPSNRKLADFRLRFAGFRVSLASGADEAIEKALADPPHAILSDILMPGTDGFRLCLAVRKEPRLARVPVVLVSSSYVDDADRHLAQQVGASAFVLRTADLREAVEVLLEVVRSNRPIPTPNTEPDFDRAHLNRVLDQLSRQLEANRLLAQRTTLHSATISVLSGICEALARPHEIESVVAEILVHCLDASGLSTGFLYVIEPGGGLGLHAECGIPPGRVEDAIGAFGTSPLVRQIVENGLPAPIPPHAPGAPPLLAILGLTNVLVVPLPAMGARRGALILASDADELSTPSWLGFARALSVQLGQALALGQTVSNLAESELRYRTLFEKAEEGIFRSTADGRFLDSNPAFARMLGYESPEELSSTVTDISRQLWVRPQERLDIIRHFSLESPIAGREVELWRKDGSTAWLRMSWRGTLAADKTRRFEGIAVDVTEKRRAEDALQRSEKRLRRIIASNPAVIYVLEPAGEFVTATWVSPNVAEMTGFSPEEAMDPEWWSSNVHPDDRESAFAGTMSVFERNHVVHEYRIRRRNGEYIWVRDEKVLERNPDGTPLEIVGSWADITETHRAEEAFEELRLKHERILESLAEGVHVLAPDGTIAFENPAAARMLGWKLGEFFGCDGHEAKHSRRENGAPYPREECPINRTLRDGEVRRVNDEVFWRKDGTSIPVEYVVSPIRGDRVDPGGVVVAFRDVSETRSLTTQLLHAQKMEAVGRLAGGVAHDFNNLLTVILGYSSLALSRLSPSDRIAAELKEIENAGRRAAALTAQLLVFSRRQVLVPKVIDLNDLINGIVKMLSRVIGEDVDIQTRLAADLPGVKVDPGQMEQVLMNLAVNARDAMPKGGRLTIETAEVTLDEEAAWQHNGMTAGPFVMLAVSDTGCGMDRKTQERIFEPFFTTKEIGKGTGLGLAMVHGVVKQSGGHIWVYSEEEKGTTFKVYLPPVMSDLQRTASGFSAAVAPRGSETLLLVEDEEAVRRLGVIVLRDCGYTVLEASSGEQALTLLEGLDSAVRLLVTDFVLPRMRGVELAEQAVKRSPNLKVLYMSGFTDIEIGDASVLSERNFLQKPFTGVGLAKKVRDLLDE